MIEYMVIGLFISTVVLPLIFSKDLSYKDAFKLGNTVFIVILAVCAAIAIVTASFMHITTDSPSLIEIYNNKFKGG